MSARNVIVPPPMISGRLLVGHSTLARLWAQDASSGNNRWPMGSYCAPD